jgi:hypothetical protein
MMRVGALKASIVCRPGLLEDASRFAGLAQGEAACGWKIEQVMSVGVGDGAFGYGFNVTTSRNQPVALFAYETREAAEAVAQHFEAAVERAVRAVPPYDVAVRELQGAELPP